MKMQSREVDKGQDKQTYPAKKVGYPCIFGYLLGVADKHPIKFQVSASGTHLERPELCSPSDNIGQSRPYN